MIVNSLQIVGYDSPLRLGQVCNLKVEVCYVSGEDIEVNNFKGAIGLERKVYGFRELSSSSVDIKLPGTKGLLEYQPIVMPIAINNVSPGRYDIWVKADNLVSVLTDAVVVLA